MSMSAFLKEQPMLGSIFPLVRCFWLRKQISRSPCFSCAYFMRSVSQKFCCWKNLFSVLSFSMLDSSQSLSAMSLMWAYISKSYFSFSLQSSSYKVFILSKRKEFSALQSTACSLQGFLNIFGSCLSSPSKSSGQSQKRSPIFLTGATLKFLLFLVDFCSLTVLSNFKWSTFSYSLVSSETLFSRKSIFLCWALILSSFSSMTVLMQVMKYFLRPATPSSSISWLECLLISTLRVLGCFPFCSFHFLSPAYLFSSQFSPKSKAALPRYWLIIACSSSFCLLSANISQWCECPCISWFLMMKPFTLDPISFRMRSSDSPYSGFAGSRPCVLVSLSSLHSLPLSSILMSSVFFLITGSVRWKRRELVFRDRLLLGKQ